MSYYSHCFELLVFNISVIFLALQIQLWWSGYDILILFKQNPGPQFSLVKQNRGRVEFHLSLLWLLFNFRFHWTSVCDGWVVVRWQNRHVFACSLGVQWVSTRLELGGELVWSGRAQHLQRAGAAGSFAPALVPMRYPGLDVLAGRRQTLRGSHWPFLWARIA